MSDGRIDLDLSGLDRVLALEPQRVAAWLDGVAEAIVTEIVLSFGTSPPGRTHTRGSVAHVASQPGYPPNVDTAALRASIRWEPTGPLERTIMDGVEYGVYLEDGTEDILPRPFMGPVFDDWRGGRLERDARQRLSLE
ncbi:MAG: hypothetical protein BroJett033_7870 [Chloroflexota bacterium]|nr:MAG: hypothetical protein BroJett033_7870 [Chloroflexota bacterium]